MRNYTFILLFFFVGLVYGQTYTINWEENKNISIGNREVSAPFFSNKEYKFDQFFIPHFSFAKDATSNGKWEIYNVRTENVPNIGAIEKNQIPNKLTYFADVVSARGIKKLSVDVTTLFKDGNQIKRITSFSLRKKQIASFSTPVAPTFSLDNSNASVLSTGNWHKISVDTTGIYRLDYDFFVSNNIPIGSSSNFKIYGNGGAMLPEPTGNFRYGALQENAILMQDGGDGSFDPGDFVLFYAQGPHVFNRDSHDLNNISHTFNIYEEKAYYFLTFDGGVGKRVSDESITGIPVETYTNFDNYQFHENDSINLYNVGRQWVGRNFSIENQQSFPFKTDNISSGDNVRVEYRFISVNAINNSVSVSLNSSPVGNFTINYSQTTPNAGLFVGSSGGGSVSATGNIVVNVNVDSSGNPGGVVYLDYLRVKYKQNLTYTNEQMRFRTLDDINDGAIRAFQFSNSGMEYVWNVSDLTNAKNVILNSNSFNYQSTSTFFNNEFIAFNADQGYTPNFEGAVANQNIRSLFDVEYIIVSHPSLVSQANRMLNHHQSNGLSCALVTTEQIYNEYGSGSADLSAIRDFLKHLYSKGDLKFVLLFGDSSYDFKDRIPNNSSNLIPSFQSFFSRDLESSFVTDDFFAILDEEDTGNFSETIILDSTKQDVAVGRMPAEDLNDARIMVDKTLDYYNSEDSFGDWRTKIHLVVDDNDCDNPFHNPIEDHTVDFLETNHPYYTIRKLYLDSFIPEITAGGRRYPAAKNAFDAALESGSLFINYFGHGGTNGWAQERILQTTEIRDYNNYNAVFKRLPVVMTITCDFSVWDVPQLTSGGEVFLRNEQGGAALMLTTSRAIGVQYGIDFNPIAVQHLFTENPNGNGEYYSVAEALRLSKVEDGNTPNHYKVNILGDPALSIVKPPRDIRLTTINGEDADTFNGTLRALDFVELEGEVLNAAGNIDLSFNGTATATLFDKPVNKTTLDNPNCLGTLEYQEQINAIFRGNTQVTNGSFKFQFYIPKDINYTVGNGKLLLYAENQIVDALGLKDDIPVGDQNPDGLNDDEGPVIGLYMNNLNFVSGGITNKDPYVLACLVDDTGINATGIGIGHDITGVLNDNVEGTVIFNDFYDGGDNNPCINSDYEDYQKGRVFYQLQNLDIGDYTLTFKAWDINNNSSTQTLDFVVVQEGEQNIVINRLLNWPNPFTDQTYFQFEHNCDSELEVLIQVFTVSGKLIKTVSQTVSSEPWLEGYRTGRFEIPWDGLDDFGNKIGKGVYIYKANVRGVNSEICSGVASEIEKLVILK